MKRRFAAVFLWLVLAPSVWGLEGWTLGQATAHIQQQAGATLAALDAQTWGEQAAREDLQMVEQRATALLQALEGRDARAVKEQQAELASAGRRLQASRVMLPPEFLQGPSWADLEQALTLVDRRLTQLRSRFDQRAAWTPGPLAEQPLEGRDAAFEIYPNPHLLLVDVRDLRLLSASLEATHFPGYGFGFMQPNNLDPLEVRRLTLAAWDLQRALESQYQDISELLDKWQKYRRLYDRLGYPGSNEVVRQLERVVERLTLFFDGVGGR